jgi:hypothetical protein
MEREERPPCGLSAAQALGLPRSGIVFGGTAAYTAWVADGSPWKDARPIHAVGDRLAAHGYTVYYHGDLRHLTNVPPEDHTPFSATGWPGAHPYPYCMATDVMPPAAGQVSKLTGRPLPSLDRLAARLAADKQAGHPQTAWLKYMNSTDADGHIWHDKWTPDHTRSASGDAGHIHLSCRTDHVTSAAADGYDLVARTEGANVTLWGWDASHYDAVPTGSKVVSEGIKFMTHKAGGDANDAELAAWWSAMKGVRDKVLIGAYWVLYPGSPTAKADAFLSRLDSQCPGWRDGPFILQADCEIWGGDSGTLPPRSDIQAFCDRLRAKAPKLTPVVYGPKWCYGNALAGLTYPLWASSYVSGSGTVSGLYPGDSSSKWGAYSGQTPLILQYTSSATIAGQTTCDGNAFKGSLAELTARLAPGWETEDMTFEADQVPVKYPAQDLTNPMWTGPHALGEARDLANETRDLVKALQNTVALNQAAVLKAVTNADDGAAVVAAVQAESKRIADQLAAAAQAETDRDAANVARLLQVLSQSGHGDPVSADELEAALQHVYGAAFSTAKARLDGPRKADGTAMTEEDRADMAAAQQRQARVRGSGE